MRKIKGVKTYKNRTIYRCKKCGDLVDKTDRYKHYYICYEEEVSPEEMRMGFVRNGPFMGV